MSTITEFASVVGLIVLVLAPRILEIYLGTSELKH